MTSTSTTTATATQSISTGLSQIRQEAQTGFRRHIPDLNTPRFVNAKRQDAYTFAHDFKTNRVPPWLFDLTQAWEQLLAEPYHGVTTDGQVIDGLFSPQDESVPVEQIKEAAETVLHNCNEDQLSKLRYPINAHEWRAWSNPEFLLRPFGLRLEELDDTLRASILAVIKASFSPEGYEKAIAAMRINHFLGQVVELPKIMNQYSYNFLLFGTPSTTEAWGWSMYGHHLCLNVFIRGRQMFISPTFTGAEPNIIDDGPWKGTSILHTEGDLGLALMQSLDASSQKEAQIYVLMHDPAMPCTGDLKSDRWNKDDQRHVCGAFRDNRMVPDEGICVSGFTDAQKRLILDIAEQFLLYLPQTARQARKALIEKHFERTFFCWIGAFGNNDPFYFRIQSPVILLEFDHHSGVYLCNTEPDKFHTHTILRMPNAGDYGQALRSVSERLA